MSRITNFLIGRVLAQNANVDSTRPALVAALVPSAVTGLVLAELVIRSEVNAAAAATVPATGGTGTTTTGGAGTTTTTGGTGTTTGGGTPIQSAVPQLVGQTVDAARDLLQREGLVLGPVGGDIGSDQPRGLVASSQPPAGTVVPRGSQVVVFTSAGAGVPSVLNMPLRQAAQTLAAAGWSLTFTRIESTAAQRDIVLEQSPAPNSFPADGSRTVGLTVGGGQRAVVPDLIGLTVRQAVDALTGASLTGLVAEGADPGDDDVVTAQDPEPFTLVEAQSRVTLTFGDVLGVPDRDDEDEGGNVDGRLE